MRNRSSRACVEGDRGRDRFTPANLSTTVAVTGIVVLFAVPLAGLLIMAMQRVPGIDAPTVTPWARLVRSGVRTLSYATVSATVCLLVGAPLALVLYRVQFWGRRLLLTLLWVPFVLPSLAVAASVSALFRGAESFRWFAVDGSGASGAAMIIAANVVFNVGLVVRLAGPQIQGIDEMTLESARMLGAGRIRIVWQVILPHALPILGRAFLLVFVLCCTNFGVVLLLGSPTSSTIDLEIWLLVTQSLDVRGAAILALVQAAAIGAVVSVLFHGRMAGGHDRVGTGSIPAQRFVSTTRSWSRPMRSVIARGRSTRPFAEKAAVASAFGAVICLIGLPLFTMVERISRTRTATGADHSLSQLVRSGHTPKGLEGLWGIHGPVSTWWYSAFTAGACALIVIGLCVMIVPGLLPSVARPRHTVAKRARFGRRVEAAVVASLAISPVVLGVGMLSAKRWAFAGFGSEPLVLIWTLVCVSLPFGVALVADAARAVSRRSLESARLLGATDLSASLRVGGLMIAPAVATASALVAAIAFGDIGAASFVADGSQPTVAIVSRQFLARPQPIAYQHGLTLALAIGLLSAAMALLAPGQRTRWRSRVCRLFVSSLRSLSDRRGRGRSSVTS